MISARHLGIQQKRLDLRPPAIHNVFFPPQGPLMEYEIDEEDFTALPVPNWPDEEEADQIVEASEAVELYEGSGEVGTGIGVGVEKSPRKSNLKKHLSKIGWLTRVTSSASYRT